MKKLALGLLLTAFAPQAMAYMHFTLECKTKPNLGIKPNPGSDFELPNVKDSVYAKFKYDAYNGKFNGNIVVNREPISIVNEFDENFFKNEELTVFAWQSPSLPDIQLKLNIVEHDLIKDMYAGVLIVGRHTVGVYCTEFKYPAGAIRPL